MACVARCETEARKGGKVNMKTMKNVAVVNCDGTAMGLGATEAEARHNAIACGVDAERVQELRTVRLTAASVEAIESGDPDAVEIDEN